MEALKNEQIYQPTIANDTQYECQRNATHSFSRYRIESCATYEEETLHGKPLDADYFKENLVWPNDKVKARKWTRWVQRIPFSNT